MAFAIVQRFQDAVVGGNGTCKVYFRRIGSLLAIVEGSMFPQVGGRPTEGILRMKVCHSVEPQRSKAWDNREGTMGHHFMDRSWTNRGLHRQQDCQQDGRRAASRLLLGIIGAFVGGWIFTAMGAAGVTVAVIGAVVVLVVYHAIFGQRATA
jgi:hypothetical protein